MKVGSEGNFEAKIALVGEAPGETEERQGRPFVGAAGGLLDTKLRTAGIMRDRCYITNVVKQRPENNDISIFIDLKSKEVKMSSVYLQYEDFLREELSKSRANVIVALGAVPLWALCRKRGITKWRGSILESTLLSGKKVIPTIHPAAALREYTFQHFITMDLQKILKQSLFPEIILPKRNIITSPTFEQAMRYLMEVQELDMVGTDIEVMRKEVSCISFAKSPTDAISIPFYCKHKDYFNPKQELEIWQTIANIYEDIGITKVFQNGMFDMSFLFTKYGIRTSNVDDTMVAHAILYPDFPKGLDFITSTLTDEPYYKDEGKQYFKTSESDEKFWEYNAKDSLMLMEIFPKLFVDLHRMDNIDAYEAKMSELYPLMYMQARGMKVDYYKLTQTRKNAEEEERNLLVKFQTECGFPINPASPKQLQQYFYITRGYKPYVGKDGKVSVDDDALKRLIKQGAMQASTLREYRSVAKMKSTYLDVTLDEDNRLRGSINPVGTVNGRPSSSKTIFGTGLNLFNMPHSFENIIVADTDFLCVNIDLAKAENRVVAYIAPDQTMIDAFEKNIDLHSLTASMIFRKPIEEISDEPGSSILGNGEHSERFWGKKANHGLNYDLGKRTFALYYEMPESEANLIIERYHQGYPGVRQYHEWIQSSLRNNRRLKDCFGKTRLFLDRWCDQLFKDAYAYIPQSTIERITSQWGYVYIYNNQKKFKHIQLLNTIYDSIKFQLNYRDYTIDNTVWAEILWDIKKNLEQYIYWKGREFNIPCDIKVGKNFGNMKTLKGNFTCMEDMVEPIGMLLEEVLSGS